jgi:hypothetical protein
MNTANDCVDTRRLKSIPEVTEEYKSLRDLSSSEKPPKVHAKLINDTILEERESIGLRDPEFEDQEEEDMEDFSDHNSNSKAD